MPLAIGDRAPDLRLPSETKEPIGFSDFPGRPVVVLFFPFAFSSVCTEEICSVGNDFEAYRALDAQLLAVSVDSPYVLARFKRECGVDFPFLSDFNREAANAFGVLRAAPTGPGLRNATERAAFVIGPDGTIRYAWVGEHPGVMPDFGAIKTALEKS